MRITGNMMKDNVLYYLNKNLNRLDKTNSQLSTGKKFNLPEDDPINAVIDMKYRSKITENTQYVRNIDDAVTWMSTADRALEHGTELLHRVRDLAIYGANDTLSADEREALALEVNELLNGMIEVGNTELRGDYIFAGQHTQQKPFEVKYGGDPGQTPHVLSHDWRGGMMPDKLKINEDNVTEILYTGDSDDILRQVQHARTNPINDPGSFLFQSNIHKVTGGNYVSNAYSIVNSPINFSQNVNPLDGEGVFSVGIKGSRLTPITYDSDRDSLVSIVGKINEADAGVTASYIKEYDRNNQPIFKLVIEANDPGKEVSIEDAGREKVTRSETSVAVDTTDAWYDLYSGASPSWSESVVINGEKFILRDYAGIEDFMYAVEINENAGIEDFSFDISKNRFSITAEEGSHISMHQEIFDPTITAGFFEKAKINESGNLMERLGMVNKIVGTNPTLNGDPTDLSTNILLQTVAPETVETGDITINGELINIDVETDNLARIAEKINEADVGVTAKIEAVADPATGQFAALPEDRLYRLVLISDKPKAIELTDRDTGFLKEFGIMETSTFEKPDSEYLVNFNLQPMYGEFQDPNSHNVFQAIMNIRDNLFADDDNKLSDEDIVAIDEAIDSFLQQRSKIGARINTIETTQEKLKDVNVNTEDLLSRIEDVDIAETIMQLKMQESVYNASLSAGSRLMQPTLADFIR